MAPPTSSLHRAILLAENRLASATLSGGTWVRGLESLRTPALRGDPARCTAGTPAAATLTATWPRARSFGAVALLGHTLPLRATWRLVWQAGGVTVRDETLPVNPRAWPSLSRPWDTDNWWSGVVAGSNAIWLPEGAVRADRLTLVIDPLGQPFDLGALWVGPADRTAWGIDWGRQIGPSYATVADPLPGGGSLFDRRRTGRRQTVTWSDLDKVEAYRMLDRLLALDLVDPLLLVPDPGDAAAMVRDTFLARVDAQARPQLTETSSPGLYSLSLTLTEVME